MVQPLAVLYPSFEEGGGYLYCFRSVSRNQYFPSHIFQQPCITATSNLAWCFGQGSYTSLTKLTSASYLFPVLRLSLFSDITWSRNFCHTFLGNHASQQLETCYGASARDPTNHLPNFRRSVIYFPFYDFIFRHYIVKCQISSHFVRVY